MTQPLPRGSQAQLLDTHAAFEEVVKYWEELDDDVQMVTVSDLHAVMAQHCVQPWTTKWLKKKMLDRFQDSIIIGNMCGRKDLIVESESISAIINGFHQDQTRDTLEMKERMIKSAAKLLASEIRAQDFDTSNYFAVDELDEERQLNELPASLINFLQALRPKRSKELNMPIACIGQSIMHLAAPHYLPPLHVALASQVHARSGSQLLVDSLHNFGFSASAKTVRAFERSSALQDPFTGNESDIDESEDVEIDGGVASADNVDNGPFLGMGMIFSYLTKNSSFSKTSKKIPRIKVTKEQLLSRAVKIHHYPSGPDKKIIRDLVLKPINCCPSPFVLSMPSPISYLRAASLARDPSIPSLGGSMRVMTKFNTHSGIHNIAYLPIIDLPATNMSCVLSTLSYIYQICMSS